ncbi:MAG TPA: hypothetical protein VGZ71_16820 [Puia sp.]|jgi:hypothetical protein|nr:hypothetical protein [Puia sp.]
MKTASFLYFIVVCASLNAQSIVAGHYRNYFGGSVNIAPDSTFKYSWHFDLQGSWTKGRWRMTKDTVYFTMIPVYDTISHTIKNGEIGDSLVLSVDEIPERITLNLNALYSGGQNIQPYPTKLLYRKNRLYEIDKLGKLNKKWRRGFWSKKKWPPWFARVITETE